MTRPAPQSSVTRRGFLATGIAAGVGALCSHPLRGGDSPVIITKVIPATGEQLPAIGIGTDSFRAGMRDDLRAELKRMSELGATVIDTSDDYGDSETIIGEALEGLGT